MPVSFTGKIYMTTSISDFEIHDTLPEQFAPQVEVAACYLEIDGKILVLQKTSTQPEPGTWGIPAGKLEQHETPINAATRELFEETGIDLKISNLQHIYTFYIKKLGNNFIFHAFKVDLPSAQIPKIQLSSEHQNYKWATPDDLQNMPLVAGGWAAFQRYRASFPKKRTGSSVSVYLIIQQNNQVFLTLRKNTGYNDGLWSLVAGHVEDGEAATAAMIREAREEIGIELSPEQIKVAHIMHRRSNRQNVDIFFICSSWEGVPQNCELEKCEKIDFFPLDALPKNTINYNAYVLSAIARGEFYSEHGWN
jgi:mutator protein MutT